ncbi:MAG: hypothetical protein ACRD1U_07395 [Vicinamibacterales bacterium]
MMVNLDESQRQVIRFTLGVAFGTWLCSQIADSSLVGRFWSQLSLLAIGAGALRIWLLEIAKTEHSR